MAGEEGDTRVVGLKPPDRLRPTGSESHRMEVRNLEITLGEKIKVEAHGGIQAH